MGFLETLSRGLNRWVEGALVLLGVTMSALVALQVFCRYALNHSLFWSEELARYLLVWLSFLGATVAYRRGAHPGIDVLPARLAPAARRAVLLAVHVAALALFAVMTVEGFRFAYFVRHQISPALHLPKWFPHLAVPVSGLLFAVHGVALLVRDVRKGGRA